MRRIVWVLTLIIVLAVLANTAFAQSATLPPAPASTPEITPEGTSDVYPPIDIMQPIVLNTYPHSTASYTEGLFLYNGFLYESAGEYGQSDLHKVDLKTGKVLQTVTVAPQYFGEGIALVDDHIFQLTWKEAKVFEYNADTFAPISNNFTYEGEGWGMCYDGTQLWMSNGSDTLVTRDPNTFAVTRQVKLLFQGHTLDTVTTANGVPLSTMFDEVNELECVGDSIYANVYLTDNILRIDAATGEITGIITADKLLTADERKALQGGEVLNGIAYNPDTNTFYLTGKHWPKLFEVKFNVVSTISLNG